MKTVPFALAGMAAALAIATPILARDTARATDLFQFGGASGYAPQGGVIADRSGTVFGTTTLGGTGPCIAGAGCGTVYALSAPAAGGGSWVFNKLYDFQGGQDGSFPRSQLTVAPNGTVYGYTADGSPGAVFRLTPPTIAGQPWAFKVLYVFTGKADGNLEAVFSPLIFRHGALYGVASGGASTACGQFGCGSVFKLTPGSGGGAWTLRTVFRFAGGPESGEPNGIVGFNEPGPLYVSTSLGSGAVVEVSPPASPGEWTEQVITRFDRDGGGHSPSNLVLAPDGSLFGLTNTRAGLVFHLTPPAAPGAPWTRAVIATVVDRGYGPASLAVGPAGSLIGAIQGDFDFFAGAVFQLTPPAAGGSWTYAELFNFNRFQDRNPINVVPGRRGNLFGVLGGGDSTNGSLFELTLP